MKAMYPGTFDPITRGHADLALRAASIFDEVVVAVAINAGKNPIFTLAERIDMVDAVLLGHIEVVGYEDLTIQAAKRFGCDVIVRGLRAVTDFEYEFQIAHVNTSIAPEIETIFLPSKMEFTLISSSVVRDLIKYGTNVSKFVHPYVEKKLQEKVKK